MAFPQIRSRLKLGSPATQVGYVLTILSAIEQVIIYYQMPSIIITKNLLAKRKKRAVLAAADLLFCSDRISSGLKSPILHFFQVSLPTLVSKTFKLTENNLFSCHLGLPAQTAYCTILL